MGSGSSGRSGESKLSIRRIDAYKRQQQALELRMAGYGWQDIAEQLGYSDHSGAFRAVESALQKTLQPPADEYRAITLERLTKVLKSFWPQMLNGDIPAANICLKTIKDMRELMGVDMPSRVEHTGAGGAPIQHEVVTIDIGDLTDALATLQDVGAIRMETNGQHPVALESLHPPQANE